MSEQEQPPVGAAMWGGRRLLRGERDLTVVPDDTPDERVVSLADAAALVLLGVGTALVPLGVALAAGPGWALAVFGAMCFTLGIIVGVGGSR